MTYKNSRLKHVKPTLVIEDDGTKSLKFLPDYTELLPKLLDEQAKLVVFWVRVFGMAILIFIDWRIALAVFLITFK